LARAVSILVVPQVSPGGQSHQNRMRHFRARLGVKVIYTLLGAAAAIYMVKVFQTASTATWVVAGGTRSKATLSLERSRAALLAARATPDELFMQAVRMSQGGNAPPDEMKKAIGFLHEAAELGHVEAQSNLGAFYAEGFGGLPRDFQMAQKWFGAAAAAGNPDAMYNLGMMKFNGLGEPQDKRGAAKLYKIAAEGGNPAAMEDLAQMFLKGDGIPKDMQEGAKWLVQAAQAGGYLEDLVSRIQEGNLDTETSIKLSEMIEKLRDINRENPYMDPQNAQPR